MKALLLFALLGTFYAQATAAPVVQRDPIQFPVIDIGYSPDLFLFPAAPANCPLVINSNFGVPCKPRLHTPQKH